jgi:hypothetical protein
MAPLPRTDEEFGKHLQQPQSAHQDNRLPAISQGAQAASLVNFISLLLMHLDLPKGTCLIAEAMHCGERLNLPPV